MNWLKMMTENVQSPGQPSRRDFFVLLFLVSFFVCFSNIIVAKGGIKSYLAYGKLEFWVRPAASVSLPENDSETTVRPNSHFAIVQFDSRQTASNASHWFTSRRWNQAYCRHHDHTYIFYSLKEGDRCTSHDGALTLADPWCKVKTMLQVEEDYKFVEYFLYLDSDSVIAQQFYNQSLNDMLTSMQKQLNWNIDEKPVVFNQDGPGWWCKQVVATVPGYTWCLNAGTVFWHRSPRATAVLTKWWESSTDAYDDNPLKFSFRDEWPWEQDRQMAICHANDTIASYIQVASQPERPYMDMERGHTHWCLSHLERSNCFVSHYCEDASMKQKMMDLYEDFMRTIFGMNNPIESYPVEFLRL